MIVGLDPALPLFRDKDSGSHLHATDAEHTASGCLGFDEPIGAVSFYPNYNGRQHKMPRCGLDFRWSCSYDRAYEYFAESINSSIGFKGWKCSNSSKLTKNNCPDFFQEYWSMGGEPLDVESRGVVTLKTEINPSFARRPTTGQTEPDFETIVPASNCYYFKYLDNYDDRKAKA